MGYSMASNPTRAKRCLRVRGIHDLETRQHASSVVGSSCSWSTMRSSISGGRVHDIVVILHHVQNSRRQLRLASHDAHEVRIPFTNRVPLSPMILSTLLRTIVWGHDWLGGLPSILKSIILRVKRRWSKHEARMIYEFIETNPGVYVCNELMMASVKADYRSSILYKTITS